MERGFDSALSRDPVPSNGDPVWTDRWQTVAQLSGHHYDLPRGACGRCYVNLLCEEIRHLSRGHYSSDRLIVFSFVILQRDRSQNVNVGRRSSISLFRRLFNVIAMSLHLLVDSMLTPQRSSPVLCYKVKINQQCVILLRGRRVMSSDLMM